ncbi:MAG: erythromycin esterase family protein [Planctomycetota bacterium]
MRERCLRFVGVAALCVPAAVAQSNVPSNAVASDDRAIVEWLRERALPVPAAASAVSAWTAIDAVLAGAHVVGLGEATHGQRESFELKRRLTLHLVRDQGFRIVAYEASSTRARACDDYIAGRTSDMQAALHGLGMLIWRNDENAALLDDLRAWNQGSKPEDRVRFVGVDVQDGEAAGARLTELLERARSPLAAEAKGLGTKIEAARDAAYSGGDWRTFTAAAGEVDALLRSVSLAFGEIAAKTSRADAEEVLTRARELARFAEAATSAEGRDHAMAQTLLDELARAGAGTKVVLWAHNAHVTNGPLRYMGTTALGLGGVLAASLGEKYYALGFLFGEGSFAALAQDADRKWTFKSYEVPPCPGSVEATFQRARQGDLIVDLRGAPKDGDVGAWLAQSHPMRWYGGYNIPDDVVAQSIQLDKLQQIEPRVDFDGLVYIAKTSATRVWEPAGTGSAGRGK